MSNLLRKQQIWEWGWEREQLCAAVAAPEIFSWCSWSFIPIFVLCHGSDQVCLGLCLHQGMIHSPVWLLPLPVLPVKSPFIFFLQRGGSASTGCHPAVPRTRPGHPAVSGAGRKGSSYLKWDLISDSWRKSLSGCWGSVLCLIAALKTTL